MSADLATKATTLRQLHEGPRTLVLPNAWDAASAARMERAGFPEVATKRASTS